MPKKARLQESFDQASGSIVPAGNYQLLPPQLDVEPETPSVPLSHYLWILRRRASSVIVFIVSCVVLTVLVSARLQPIYESIATIDVDREAPAEVVGQDSSRSEGPLNDADQFLATQTKLIESDSVLRPVAMQYNLLAREGQLKHLRSGQDLSRAPIVLKRLRVTRPPNTYLLLVSYRDPDPAIAAQVANAIVNSYLLHTYDIRFRSTASLSTFMERQLDELRAKMEKSSLALAQFERDLDVINPEEKTNILSSRLLQLNTEYTSAQADRVRAEAAWNGIKSGSLEAAQVSSQGEPLAKLSEAVDQAQQKFALVKATYGSSHPEYKKAASELAEVKKQFEETRENIAQRLDVQYKEALNREQMLQQTVADTKAQWDHLNSRSFEYQQLKREADADKTLYDELIKKIRESNINAGFQNNNIRIADLARAGIKPVFPNIWLNMLLAILFSTLLAVGAALLLDSIDTTLRDPAEASRFLGIDVIGAMPADPAAANFGGPRIEGIEPKPLTTPTKKGYYGSTSSFEEAIRTLRNTILLSDFEGRLASLVLTSAAPSEGKSTLAAHLAIANSDRGKKTLIVDADLRRPSLHAKFGLTPKEGLSNVLNGEMAWRDVVIQIQGRPNLSLLPSGPGSHRAADLIGPRLSTLLDEFGKEFDFIILDAPPLLGFAECLQMAAAADGVLIVSVAGETRRKAVAEVISLMKRVHANVIGLVLNKVTHKTSEDGYSYYGYYKYGYYRPYKAYQDTKQEKS